MAVMVTRMGRVMIMMMMMMMVMMMMMMMTMITVLFDVTVTAATVDDHNKS